jgi:hypothetical protein
MDVVPDTKDWTWVLERPCAECGYDADAVEPADLPRRLRDNAEAWDAVLRQPEVRRRPAVGVWSPLEYGCHVRDVYRVFDGRLQRMLTEDDPVFDNWDQDATAVLEGYLDADAELVADEVEEASVAFVARVRALGPADFDRPGRRSDGAEFTVATFLQYFLHDVVHHLWDVTGQQDGAASLSLE